MDIFYEIKPRNAEFYSILLLGIRSVEIDRNGLGMDNKAFSRITVNYLNNTKEKISFRTNDDEYATQVYSEIKTRATKIIDELNLREELSSYFN